MKSGPRLSPPTAESDAELLHDFINAVEDGKVKAPLIIAPLLRGAVERLLRNEYQRKRARP